MRPRPRHSGHRMLAATAALAVATVAAVSAGLTAPATAQPAQPRQRPPSPPSQVFDVQLLAFNDYHGHLEPTTPGRVGTVSAGGSEYLAAHLARLRQGKRNTLTVAAGDLIGGTPFLSGLFHDEPSVESLNAMGLDVSSVGNHEFDEGVTELLRMQHGGCHPVDGCYFPDQPYAGADFPWLAANVVSEASGETVLPPYRIETLRGGRVAFIGMTLEGTPALVAQSGIRGWDFRDEAETANALVPELRRRGVEAIVVLLHEGGMQTGSYDGCTGISGPIVDIQRRLDPEIDIVVTGHTHEAYNCVFTDPAGQDRRVTSAMSFGRIISEITFKLDPRTRDIRRDTVRAVNHIVAQTVAPDPAQTAILDKWRPLAEEVGNKPVGTITADIRRAYVGTTEDRGSESDLGNMVADAQLWATAGNGAQIAFMNPGGLRADLRYASSPAGEGDGVVTYGEAFNTQPFGNLLSTIPMTGAQVVSVLEDQCQPAGASRPFLHLGVSRGFTYTLQRTISAGTCTAVTVSDVRLDGVPIDPAATYRVSVNNFLVDGGDNFVTFREVDPAQRVGGGIDLDALVDYLGTQGPVAPPGTGRVTELP